MSTNNLNKNNHKRGFTLVEMVIVAPIVILMIGVFIGAIITMTGDVLASRTANVLAFNIQDALNRIDQDVKLSGGLLATNNITLTSPQSFDDTATPNFKNVGTNGPMLILNTYATTENPSSPTKSLMYLSGQPNACGLENISQNPALMMNVVYFVKNNTLWRRVIAPTGYETSGCRGAVVGAPWQQPTCKPGTVVSTYCKTQDTKLVEDIQTGGFNVNYFLTPGATTPTNSSDPSDSVRQAVIDTTKTIDVSISATKNVGGRSVTQSGTIRTVSPNNIVASATTLSSSGGGSWAYKRSITVSNSGSSLSDYQIQINPFTDSSFINNTGLVGSWHFNEGSGSSTSDLSGNKFDGTITNATWDTGGKFGNDLSYNGTSAEVSAAGSVMSTVNNFTLEAWINPTNVTSEGEIIYNGNDARGYGLIVLNGKLQALYGSVVYIDSGTSIPTNQWSHVVMTRDATTTRFYVNGVQSPNTSTAAPLSPNNYFSIGHQPQCASCRYFSGKIDETKIYSRALSGSEVALRYGTSGVPKVRSDYADLRFTNAAGDAEYPYWQETDGRYWVKTPSLATGDTSVSLYYGNAIATGVSNGDNAFTFFDDFGSGSLSKWTKTSGADAFAVSSGLLQITPVGDNNYLTANTPIGVGQFIIESKIRSAHATGSSHPGFEWHANLSTGVNHRNDQIYSRPHAYNTAGNAQGAYYNGALTMSTASTGGLYNYNTWYDMKVALPDANSAKYFRNGINELNVATQQYPANTYAGIVAHGGSTIQWDNYRIRKYSAAEPTHVAPGAETTP